MPGSRAHDARSQSSRHALVVPILGALIVIAVVAFLWSRWGSESVLAWKREANPIVFFAAMALLPIVGVPITPFFVLAGATFSVPVGLAGSAAALAVNLVLSFWLARSRLRPPLERLLGRTRYSLPDLEAAPHRAFRFTMLMKVAPGLPLSVKHFAIALAGVPFLTYFLVSFAISGLYAASFIVLGGSLLQHDIGTAVAAGAVLVALGIAVAWVQRRRASELVPS